MSKDPIIYQDMTIEWLLAHAKSEEIVIPKDVTKKADIITAIVKAELNGLGAEAEEAIDNLPDAVQKTGANFLAHLVKNLANKGSLKKLGSTNKTEIKGFAGQVVADALVKSFLATIVSLIPHKSRARTVITSTAMNTILYGVLSQLLSLLANHLAAVHPKFQHIADGAARNSMMHTYESLAIGKAIRNKVPFLAEFFGDDIIPD